MTALELREEIDNCPDCNLTKDKAYCTTHSMQVHELVGERAWTEETFNNKYKT